MDRLDGHLTWEDPISDGIECPHCGALLDEDVYHASSQDTLQVYRCSGCGRYTTERGIALAQEVGRLATENEMLWEANRKMQRTVDRVEKTTTQSRNALMSERDSARAEAERLRVVLEEHETTIRALSRSDVERFKENKDLVAEVERLREALAEAVGAINSLPFDALGIHPGDDVMSPYSIRDELSWRLQTILTPHDCAGEVGK